jgi:hypothetical protein
MFSLGVLHLCHEFVPRTGPSLGSHYGLCVCVYECVCVCVCVYVCARADRAAPRRAVLRRAAPRWAAPRRAALRRAAPSRAVLSRAELCCAVPWQSGPLVGTSASQHSITELLSTHHN